MISENDATPPVTFGALLRRYRVAAGFSQAHLASVASISVESVGALERAVRRAPYRETVNALAASLDLGPPERALLEAAAHRGRARKARRAANTCGSARVNELPTHLTSFVGRASEMATLTNLMAQSRLVTITGSGGVGKTRTAIELLSLLVKTQYDIVRFVDLSLIADRAHIIDALLAQSAVPRGSRAGLDALIMSLRSSRALFVIDNCEHLIADVGVIVAAVLKSCGQVSFLATSRERIGIAGESVYHLPPLAIPVDDLPDMTAAGANAGVDLFLQRSALSCEPAGALENCIQHVVDICRQVDGIPLAIELAAAHAATLGLKTLLARLEGGLALPCGPRDLPIRQRTIAASVGWSYGLLQESERRLLQRLSIFVGGFSLALAEATCADSRLSTEHIAELLASLVDKSLISVTVASTLTVRYSMLNSVRSYASAKLSASDNRELSCAHASQLANFADFVSTEGAGRSEPWLRSEVDSELENARSAVLWALSQQTQESALFASRILRGFRTSWLRCGRPDEYVQLATAALAKFDEDRYPAVTADVRRALIQGARATSAVACTRSFHVATSRKRASRAVTTLTTECERLALARRVTLSITLPRPLPHSESRSLAPGT